MFPRASYLKKIDDAAELMPNGNCMTCSLQLELLDTFPPWHN